MGNKAWDFSAALDLVTVLAQPHAAHNHLPPSVETHASIESDTSAAITAAAAAATAAAKDSFENLSNGLPSSPKRSNQSLTRSPKLGDLNSVFQFLGTTNHASTTSVEAQYDAIPSKIDYASDGATYMSIEKRKTSRTARQAGTDVDEGNTATDRSISPPPAVATQSARSRRRQKAKKNARHNKQIPVSDSEADVVSKRTPARKASVHFLHAGPLSPITSTNQALLSNANSALHSDVKSKDFACQQPAFIQQAGRGQQLSPILDEDIVVGTNQAKHQKPESQSEHKSASAVPLTPLKHALPFVPASVLPTPTKVTPSVLLQKTSATSSYSRSTRHHTSIEPKILRSGDDRNFALFIKLVDNFPEDRGNLVNPMNLTNHNNNPHGVHVFVDASNIFIGFMEQLKRSRGIPTSCHIQKIDPSFDALALLMERRRPVAKRVLAGSTPVVPAFEQARAIGYECSILDKVYKARKLTERQIFFRDREEGLLPANAKPPPHGKRAELCDYSSGSAAAAATAPQFAPATMVEQGVDEILHLNILQSLVDCSIPSTIVLATGDAAQAEYSEGFMAMVERALKKGWNVELVSWSKNISSMYTRNQFREHWGSAFRIIFLDDYAEELLDM